MKLFLFFWGISLPVMITLDMLWFSVSLERLYKPYLGYIMSSDLNYIAAALFYILYAAGLSFLILSPGFEAHHSTPKILLSSFILGLVAYGAYDLTNHATIKDWPLTVTIIDMLWGALATSITGVISYKIITLFCR